MVVLSLPQNWVQIKDFLEKALSILPPGEIRQLHGELGQDLFEQLLKKDQKVIHDFSRTLDLAGNDTAASNAIAETLRLNKKGTIGNDDLGKAILGKLYGS